MAFPCQKSLLLEKVRCRSHISAEQDHNPARKITFFQKNNKDYVPASKKSFSFEVTKDGIYLKQKQTLSHKEWRTDIISKQQQQV